jgi:hypothetical protein
MKHEAVKMDSFHKYKRSVYVAKINLMIPHLYLKAVLSLLATDFYANASLTVKPIPVYFDEVSSFKEFLNGASELSVRLYKISEGRITASIPQNYHFSWFIGRLSIFKIMKADGDMPSGNLSQGPDDLKKIQTEPVI